MKVQKGSIDVSLYVYFVEDNDGTAPGEPKTGLVFSDIETGGSASYMRQGGARVDFTLITLASPSATHADGGFIEVDATNMPGVYRVDLPDAAFATGVEQCIIQLVAAAANNTVMNPLLIDLTNNLANVVWDEVLTKATHNVSQSAGKRIREFSSVIIRVDTAQGAGTGNNQIQLDTGASALDGAYDPALITIVSGTGLGQTRLILQYDGSTKTATVDRNWKVNPDATSEFVISADAGRNHVNEGLAQAGGTNTITLNALASPVDGIYVAQVVFIRSGTGEDQTNLIIAYNGTTKVATVHKNWSVVPDTTSGYTMIPYDHVILAETGLDDIPSTATGMVEIAKAIWDRVLTGATHNIATSAGRRLRSLQDFGLYEGGAVWIDTVNGVAGTVNFENGTITNPSSNIADALTIAGSLNLKGLRIVPASTITLAAALQDFVVMGNDYTLVLNGQNVDNTAFIGSDAVSGIFLGNPHFESSKIDSVTGPGADFHDCGFRGTILANAAGDWFAHHCYSGIAGPTTPIFDFGVDVGIGSNVTFADYQNGIEIRNYNNQGTDRLSLAGTGQVIYAASCSGEVQRRGDWLKTNLGTVTEVTDDNTAGIADVQSRVPAALVSGKMDSNMSAIAGVAASATNAERGFKALVRGACAGTPTTTVIGTDLSEATDDHYIGRVVTFTTGALAGQSAAITDYNGTTKELSVAPTALTEAPVASDEFIIS